MAEFNIRKPRGATGRKKVLGRGAGSGRGSTAGRGSKGQNARSGGRTRLGFEGGQMPLFRRIARRGFSNYPFKVNYTTVDVGALEVFAAGDTVNRSALLEKKVVRSKVGLIKILGNGTLSKSLVVDVDKVTSGARKIIEAAGGKVVENEAGPAKAAGQKAPGAKASGAKAGPAKAAGQKAPGAKASGAKADAAKAAGQKAPGPKPTAGSGLPAKGDEGPKQSQPEDAPAKGKGDSAGAVQPKATAAANTEAEPESKGPESQESGSGDGSEERES
jgi:large subunit ribosomal protein L15